MSDDNCGYDDTHSGDPCGNPPSEDDGRCWVHTGTDNQRGHRKLSHDRQQKIALAVEEGVPLVAACRLNGIRYKTHRRWMDLGEDQDEGPYAEYCQRLARALGHDQREKTQALWKIAEENDDTATMLTVLKQRYPETWQDQDIGEAQGGVHVHTDAEETVEIDPDTLETK